MDSSSRDLLGDVSIPNFTLPPSSTPSSTPSSLNSTPSLPSSHNNRPDHPPYHSSAPSYTSFPTTKASPLVTPVNPKRYVAQSHRQYKSINDSSDSLLPPHSSLSSSPSPLPTPLTRQPSSALHWPSLLCVMSLGFFANVEYGVIMPSIWNYIRSLDGEEMQMGMAIAASSAAQMCFLPIFGWWSDKRTMREVYIVALVVGIAGNAMYASAQYFRTPWLIVGGRTLIGVYAGVISVSNSFIACVTTPNTRTRFMAHMNGVNAIGLVTGPAFNLFLAKLDIKITNHLSIDALTSPAWFVGALLCISLIFFFVLFHEPTHAGDDEVGTEGEKGGEDGGIKPPTQNLSLRHYLSFLMQSFTKPWGVCFLITFVQNFDFSVLETCVTLYTTALYGFTTFQNSLMYSAMSLEMIVVIILTAIASKYASDRYIIVFGMLAMGAGVILLLVGFNTHSPFYMFSIVVGVLLIGLPSQNTAVMSCYSKLIDFAYPKEKQGLYSGVMMIFGSLARILGPLWGGFATDKVSTRDIQLLSSLLVGLFAFEFVVTLIFFKRLKVEQRVVYSINETEQRPLLSKEGEE